ncbi:putative non-specific serine/threonine protein kinase [Helianthus debilis subsp. tardiflorus]
MHVVADLARLSHENTGKLLGYCIDTSPFQRILVFEYASNGKLYEHLHCKSIFILFMSKYMPFDAVRKRAGWVGWPEMCFVRFFNEA